MSRLIAPQRSHLPRSLWRDAEIEDFLGGFYQPTHRGCGSMAKRVATWSYEHGWSGDTRPEAEWLGSPGNPNSALRLRLWRRPVLWASNSFRKNGVPVTMSVAKLITCKPYRLCE